MAFPSRKITLTSLFLAAILLLVGLPFLHLNRFRGRLESAISGSLNRPVTLGDITFQLLPTPAFDITNFVVEDDPGFSAEPMLRAEEVIVSLRWTSLWRGRLEISRLRVKYPSLNLVRLPDGRWNLETLLTRAAQVSASAAPTANTRVEQRPRFPYIEAVAGRINLKSGQEKMVWSLSDADFALWLEAENKWRMRLEGQPLRTDENLSDTGRLRLEGEFVRAPRLRETPLTLTISLQHAQLGQLTKLVYGSDRGWRGGVDLATTLQGSPQDLKATLQMVITDFRRYDIATTDQIRMEARCTGEFHSQSQAEENWLRDYAATSECIVPAAGGEVRLRAGWAQGQAGRSESFPPAAVPQDAVNPVAPPAENRPQRQPSGNETQSNSPADAARHLRVEVKNLSMASLLMVARRVKKDLPQDLTGTGAMNAAFDLIQPASELASGFPPGPQVLWNGRGTIEGLTLRSAVLGPDLVVGNVPFSANPAAPVAPHPRRRRPALSPKAPVAAPDSPMLNPFLQLAEKSQNRWVAGPFLLGLDGNTPATVAAQITRSDYQLNAQGGAAPARLLALGRALGLPGLPAGYRVISSSAPAAGDAPRAGAAIPANSMGRSFAEIDLRVAGEWAHFAPPRLAGSAQLHNVTAEIAAMAKPVEIKSANLRFSENEIAAQNIVATIPDSHIDLEGFLSIPRGCPSPQLCVMAFDFRAGQVDLDELNRLLNPRLGAGLWSFLRASLPGSSPSNNTGVSNFWKNRRAQGHLTIDRLIIKRLTASQFTAGVTLAGDKLLLSNARASLLGGASQGQWSADFSVDPPVFEGNGAAQNVSLSEVAAMMRDNWAAGPASITYRVSFSGHSFDDYKHSMIAALSFDWKNGLLRHVVLDGGAPLSFAQWSGKAEVANQDVLFTPGRMQTRFGAGSAQGTASFARNINFTISVLNSGYAISGTLSQPVVFPASQADKSAASRAPAR